MHLPCGPEPGTRSHPRNLITTEILIFNYKTIKNKDKYRQQKKYLGNKIVAVCDLTFIYLINKNIFNTRFVSLIINQEGFSFQTLTTSKSSWCSQGTEPMGVSALTQDDSGHTAFWEIPRTSGTFTEMSSWWVMQGRGGEWWAKHALINIYEYNINMHEGRKS